MKIHEVVKHSLAEELTETLRNYEIHPPLNKSNPELSISGFIKAKNQDIVILFDADKPTPEIINDGPLEGQYDKVGKAISEKSIVIGIRSQLSSVAKNFDTLMERAFAETLNLRLRLPSLVMGEAYLLPIYEYDDQAMIKGRVEWKRNPVPIKKFIKTFLGISGRNSVDDDLYKYERSTLILVDLKESPPKLFLTNNDLIRAGLIDQNTIDFQTLSPVDFAKDVITIHDNKHPHQ